MGILTDLEDIIAMRPHHRRMQHTGVHYSSTSAGLCAAISIIPPHPQGRQTADFPPIHPILANGPPLESNHPRDGWDGQVPKCCYKRNSPSPAFSGLPVSARPHPSSVCQLLPVHYPRSTAASQTYLARGACGHSISAAMCA